MPTTPFRHTVRLPLGVLVDAYGNVAEAVALVHGNLVHNNCPTVKEKKR